MSKMECTSRCQKTTPLFHFLLQTLLLLLSLYSFPILPLRPLSSWLYLFLLSLHSPPHSPPQPFLTSVHFIAFNILLLPIHWSPPFFLPCIASSLPECISPTPSHYSSPFLRLCTSFRFDILFTHLIPTLFPTFYKIFVYRLIGAAQTRASWRPWFSVQLSDVS